MQRRQTTAFAGSETLSDDVCQRLRQGDMVAFQQVFAYYYDPLCAWVETFVDQSTLTVTIVQDVFVELWQHLGDLSPHWSIGAHLFHAARRQAAAQENVERRGPFQDGGIASPTSRYLFSLKRRMCIHEARAKQLLAALSQQAQDILWLRVNHLNHDEIGYVLGIPTHIVRKEILASYRHLYRCLESNTPTAKR
jgi:DNA-directed RNA polymerase specialized sigma24 family protein